MFQKSVLKSIAQDESLVAIRWAEYQKYLAKIDFIKIVKEEKYQDGFLKDIFENCLGYTLDSTNPNDFNLEREKKNETDAKKADGVIYVDNKVIGVIELKAQDTKNLDKIETQAFNYHNSHSNSKYIIISNFDELRFYIDKKTAYEKFSLFNLDYEEFKKLHLLLSYESIKNNIPLTLKDKSASFEKDISNKLYKDFSLFRTHLFENLVKYNRLDKALLLRLTQKLCDRIIFILFAEDRGLLTVNTIKEIRQRHQSDGFGDRSMYDYYKLYFDAINRGNEKLNIPKYNGGLFAVDDTLDSLIIDDTILDMEAQALSNYDFMSDVSVNILGHIFEQSLTDLEEINASINDTEFDSKKSKRKKDGVFYTPEYITRYIVDNTLGKLCNDKREELNIGSETLVSPKNSKKPTKKEQILKDNLEKYRNWLLNLKILDPACGSGAFLNQALDFLIREHQSLQKDLVIMGDITAYYEIEKSILENNLYGVDINEDAVEIAKLSLWLRTASKGRELTKLADKILCANSLLDMPFEENSFDVVIGNPPYVALNKIKDIDYSKFEVFEKTGDLLALFIEKGVHLTKEKGKFSFIVSNSWLKTKYGESLKKFLEKNTQSHVINFKETQLFEDATVESCIISAIRQSSLTIKPINIINIRNFMNINASAETIEEAILKSILKDDSELRLMQHIEKVGKLLKEWNISINRGILTGFNQAFIIDTETKNELIKRDEKNSEIIKPILRGRDVQKYEIHWSEKWLINSHNNPPIDINNYPTIKEHLNQYYERLQKRGDKGKTPYNLRNCAYLSELDKPKIIWGEISNKPKFAYDTDKNYAEATSFIMTGENLKYLLAFLNSNLSKWYFKKISTTTGMGTNRWKKFKLELLPIAIADDESLFIQLVDEILELKKKIEKYKFLLDEAIVNDSFDREIKLKEEIEKFTKTVLSNEGELDSMIYKLYELSDDEIIIVENS